MEDKMKALITLICVFGILAFTAILATCQNTETKTMLDAGCSRAYKGSGIFWECPGKQPTK